MATTILKSKLFGMETVEQTMTLMLLAQSEGMHPATAARDFHIIKGRPSMKADAMLARFQQSGGKVIWQEYTDAKVAATFEHPQSPKPVLIEWTFAQAQKIGLTGKDNWKHYPRAMLRARVISEGVRTCYPVISTGIYTPEEVQDFEPAKERDITADSVQLPSAPINPTTGALASLTAQRQTAIMETAEGIKAAFADDKPLDAYALYSTSGFDNDEKVALWSLLPSEIRSALKRMKAAEEAPPGAISDAQKRRLEAMISEFKLDREAVKKFCRESYSKEHFAELTPAEYTDLEETLKDMKAAAEATT